MKRAIIKLKKNPIIIFIDGNKLPKIENYKLKSIIKGDQKIPSISAASVIAKVARDKINSNLGKKFKGYYWNKNCEKTIAWNDDDLSIKWPLIEEDLSKLNLSNKDLNASKMNELEFDNLF